MTTFYRTGEKIGGEKIYYWFGSVSKPRQKRGTRQFRVELGLHGGAMVVKPLKRPEAVIRRVTDEIRCVSAVGIAGEITMSGKKIHAGSHRCFEGYLKGDAECTISVPMENRPDAQRPQG